MTKYLMTGVAAVLMTTGIAAAQSDTNNTATQTTSRSVTTPDGVTETKTDTVKKPVPTDGDFHAITTIKRKKANGMVTEETRSFTAGADGTRNDLTFGAKTSAGTEVEKKSEKKTDLTGQSRTDSTTTIRPPE